ncbi:MAG: hypothetical protein DSZ06_04870 [Sulfurospirillum sp.]|nr:MAG: hypothetical protein DSZ06_04870 [Sulfurospirillum sp.]
MFELIILIIYAVVLLMIIAYLYFKDKSVYQKLSIYEKAIDELNQKIYHLEKNKTGPSIKPSDLSEAFKRIEEKFDEKLNDLGEPLLRTVRAYRAMQERLEVLEQKVDEGINNLKASTKVQSQESAPSTYEERIIKLFKEGKNIEEISKLTRVGIGEIELILKLSNLKK